MTRLALMPRSEKLAEGSPFPRLSRPLLYHQVRTLESLRRFDLVVNTYDTGTGKTFASLLYLFDLDEYNKDRFPHRNVLFIAPTNALLGQHEETVCLFVREYDLDFNVMRLTADVVREMRGGLRKGEALQRFVANYLEFEGDRAEVRRKPMVLVVNPDIYYYAMFFRYAHHDRRNVFEQFLTRFDYIIIDEFHYYNSKQLANFLFLFALFDQFGYFDVRSRKICLLSATPNAKVMEYIRRLLGDEGGRWVMVSPNNEPGESSSLPTIPSLAPLELEIASDELQEWVEGHADDLVKWVVEDDLDGAIISSSLWRINEAYGFLRRKLSEEHMGRITGPEPEMARQDATARDLVLATPTVDIGYNFEKMGKPRQNVDFLICDARYGDELIQRIGRAGRVLGKEETDVPSRAVALLPDVVAECLAEYDGRTMTRDEFRGVISSLRDAGVLPDKNTLYGYVKSHAVLECFWPIFQLGQMMPDYLYEELENLYRLMLDVFDVDVGRGFKGLRWIFVKHTWRKRWLHEAKRNPSRPPRNTAEHIADWLEWRCPTEGKPDVSEVEPYVSDVWSNERKALIEFVEEQVALVEALFSFRDSFHGPEAAVYDPYGLLSSQRINVYDVFHILSYYDISVLGREYFRDICEREGEVLPKADVYLELKGYRDRKLSATLTYSTGDGQEEFEAKRFHKVVALRGIGLVMRERGGDVVSGVVPDQVQKAMGKKMFPLLLISPARDYVALSRVKGTSIWPRRMVVYFGDGSEDEYLAFVGTSAFMAEAEMWWYFRAKERAEAKAIIL